jgi:hypothetical protein
VSVIFISNLIRGGVHPKTAQELARHATIGLTMNRYTHVYRGDLSKALKILPPLSIPVERSAMGTDGESIESSVTPNESLSPPLSVEAGFRKDRAESSGVIKSASIPGTTNKKSP